MGELRRMAAGACGPSFEARREERRAPQDDGATVAGAFNPMPAQSRDSQNACSSATRQSRRDPHRQARCAMRRDWPSGFRHAMLSGSRRRRPDRAAISARPAPRLRRACVRLPSAFRRRRTGPAPAGSRLRAGSISPQDIFAAGFGRERRGVRPDCRRSRTD